MGYDLKQINPTKCQFSFRLGKFDCYALRKGVCSLYLSEEEAEHIRKEENNIHFHDGDVMHCRNLAKSLLDVNYFENPSFQEDSGFSIIMHPKDCGHFAFTDGQHRTCIAKHLNIDSMYVQMEIHERDYSLNCRACHQKKEQEIEDRKLKNRIISKLSFIKKKEKKIPSDFIDEERMSFKKETLFIKEIEEIR
ncbi:hypothetical protein A3863_10390 [Priestia endophytica]|uniref:hypothetical protein n=1 Tax=Priestia endophytica TaxID=135735 RepID=UPI000DCA4146|nr:hypothetical protein [Priestia endophytica]RAS89619.1 hypothetical protein A3863_10390 [Priestia endophytica]